MLNPEDFMWLNLRPDEPDDKDMNDTNRNSITVRRYILEQSHGTWNSYIHAFSGKQYYSEVDCFAEALTFLTGDDALSAIRGKFNAEVWTPVMIEIRLVDGSGNAEG